MKQQRILLIFAICIISLINLSSALLIKSVSMYPDQISQGESSQVRILIDNNGNNDLTDISVVLDLSTVPFAPYNSGSEFGIDKLKEGRTNEAEFEIIALNSAKPGIYKIPVQIIYTENSLQKTKSSLISITVKSKPVIGVDLESSVLLKTSENTVNIRVTNKGLSDIQFLEISLDKSTYFDILSSNTAYIGDLNSNDFDTGSFNLYFKETTPDKITLPVTIKYQDTLNKQYIEKKDITLQVYTTQKAKQLGLIKTTSYTLYIIIIIVLIIIYLIYKKRKNKKREEERF
jgi:uncharacterized membrane protein